MNDKYMRELSDRAACLYGELYQIVGVDDCSLVEYKMRQISIIMLRIKRMERKRHEKGE